MEVQLKNGDEKILSPLCFPATVRHFLFSYKILRSHLNLHHVCTYVGALDFGSSPPLFPIYLLKAGRVGLTRTTWDVYLE